MNRQHNGQKKKVQKDKQRSTKRTHKPKDRVTRTPLKTAVLPLRRGKIDPFHAIAPEMAQTLSIIFLLCVHVRTL